VKANGYLIRVIRVVFDPIVHVTAQRRDRVFYRVVVIVSQLQREFDSRSTQRLSIARVINTNTHRKLVSRPSLRSGSHSDLENANERSAQLNKSFRWCNSEL
jgi:hypothetical protein